MITMLKLESALLTPSFRLRVIGYVPTSELDVGLIVIIIVPVEKVMKLGRVDVVNVTV